MQHHLSTRDHYIRQLEVDNMRLRIRLEQADQDIQMATKMIMVTARSNRDNCTQFVMPKMTTPVMVSRTVADRLKSRPSVVEDGWGARGDKDKGWPTVGIYKYASDFEGTGGDATGAAEAGYNANAEWGYIPSSRR
jgi:hypothetical protein